MRRSLYRPATSIHQLLRPCQNIRTLASKRAIRAARPRHVVAGYREQELPRDPEVLVRTVHEKERAAFRYALSRKDLAGAYQIYVEQRELPILSGAEVTSLIQLISADALLRSLHGLEQPGSLQEVFWSIIQDVQGRKVSGQTMLWTHALDALISWQHYERAQELWSYLQKLPNRTMLDKHDAHYIDSRVYGSAVKLFCAMGDLPTAESLYKEALIDRRLEPSLMLEQAMISALFQYGRIGDAYKLMDNAIRTQRLSLRPTFFNAMITLALDADAVGVATEIFMKACNVRMAPSAAQVTRLLSAIGKLPKDALKISDTVFRHYQQATGGKLPVEHVNTVINAVFQSGQSGLATSEILERVHLLLSEMQAYGVRATSSTVNILLAGYLEIGEYAMVDDLLARATLNEVSFRTMLKAMTRKNSPVHFSRLKHIWSSFVNYRQNNGSTFVLRDYQMLLRSAYKCNSELTNEWIPEVMASAMKVLDGTSAETLQNEWHDHQAGSFLHTNRNSAV